MAKVTGPLLSFSARGKLANSMVFSAWKGIQDVRQFVVPANPRTTEQVAQRGLFANAVARWHELTGDDRDAWNRSAGVAATPQTGFNAHTRNDIALQRVSPDAYEAHAVTVTAGSGQLTVSAHAMKVADGTEDSGSLMLRAVYGSTPGKTDHEITLSYVSENADYEGTISGLTPGATYYVRIAGQPSTPTGTAPLSGAYSATPTT